LVLERATILGTSVRFRFAAGPGPSAPAIVLVHGLGVSSRYMTPLIEALAPSHRVYAPDLPGFGGSARPRPALDVDELADALAAFMAAVGEPAATVLGNSLGAQIALALADRHPARVRRLVLLGPTGHPRSRSLLGQAIRLACDAAFERPTLAAIAVRDYLWAGPGRVLATFRTALRDRPELRLAQLRAPLLVLRGARDTVVPQRWALELAAMAGPDARLAVVPGAAHAAHFTAPGAVASAVRAFEAERPDVVGEEASPW
jgi:pimeloyl-ACP methyl ester carboxylesterase